MDKVQWRFICDAIRQAVRKMPRLRRCSYSDFLIIAMYFWSVKHDRSMMWACDRRNYNSVFRPRNLPSISQFHRRIMSPRSARILQHVNDLLSPRDNLGGCLVVDGKPLIVSNVSKDPDARVGHVQGGFAKGYKLHAMIALHGDFVCWCVRPLNEHEMPIAMRMLDSLPSIRPGTLILADGNYDASELHKAAHSRGARLTCNLRGKAIHPVTLRQMGQARRDLIELSETSPELLDVTLRHRGTIETRFGNLTTQGLGPLPYFVRRLPRVRRWAGAKLTLYHARKKSLELERNAAA